jgi:hypothetical protein
MRIVRMTGVSADSVTIRTTAIPHQRGLRGPSHGADSVMGNQAGRYRVGLAVQSKFSENYRGCDRYAIGPEIYAFLA